MDWTQITNNWLTTLLRLAALGAAFGLLAWLMPCNRGMFWWQNLRGAVTDFIYWFIVPLFTRFAAIAILVLGVSLFYGGAEPNLLPVRSLPLWLQCLLILLVQDFLLYWIHRGFHGRWGWKFHAIHHSPKVLDWMSTARFHPVNQILSFSVVDVAVLLLGFSEGALATLAVFNVVYSAFVHANLNWTFGPFRYVLASPVFHRWHHTTEEAGLDKNFASTFPILDLMFGTFYMPAGKLPVTFGTGDDEVPESFLGQLIYPFRWAGALTSQGVRTVLGISCVGLIGIGWLAVLGSPQGSTTGRTRAEQVANPDYSLLYTMTPGVPVRSVAISADGRFIASACADNSVKLWEPAAGRGINLNGHTRSVRSVAMSADARRILSGGFDRVVRLWDAQTQRERSSRTDPLGVLGVAISADGSTLVSAGAEGVVRVWKAGESSAPRALRARDTVPGVALSPEGAFVAGACVDGSIRVWETNKEGEQEFRGPKGIAFCVALSEGAKHVVAGGQDGIVYVWDGSTGKQLHALPGHHDGVLSVAITHSGERIVSGGNDGVVRVWNARIGQEEASFPSHVGPVAGVALSGDGCWAASGSQDGTIKLWQLSRSAQTYPTGSEEAASE